MLVLGRREELTARWWIAPPPGRGPGERPPEDGGFREPTDIAWTHGFPPAFDMPPEWGPELESLALELGFTLSTAGEIEGRFREVIELLGRTTPSRE
jgi:hypothetical protein